MTPAERMRIYRKEHPEVVKETKRRSWQRISRYTRRKKRLGDKRCEFCEILLAGRTVRLKQTKYCDTCKNRPEIKKALRNLYQRRWYAKKHGKEIPKVAFLEFRL